ncbi:hypothetical protein L1887_61005 [Cichorium endivia]|nr:hypothetical protein L1887_61005 [Cichorium endivia]
MVSSTVSAGRRVFFFFVPRVLCCAVFHAEASFSLSACLICAHGPVTSQADLLLTPRFDNAQSGMNGLRKGGIEGGRGERPRRRSGHGQEGAPGWWFRVLFTRLTMVKERRHRGLGMWSEKNRWFRLTELRWRGREREAGTRCRGQLGNSAGTQR